MKLSGMSLDAKVCPRKVFKVPNSTSFSSRGSNNDFGGHKWFCSSELVENK